MTDTGVIHLLVNVSVLVSLSAVLDILIGRANVGEVTYRQAWAGFLIAAAGTVVMSTPWTIAPGLVFDTRSILLSISGLFFGALATGIATIVLLVLRFIMGGAGVWMGMAVILSSAVIGLAWRHLRSRSLHDLTPKELLIMGVVVHVVMLACSLFLPRTLLWPTLKQISVLVLTIYPLGTMLVGMLMVQRFLRFEQSRRLQAETELLKLSEKTVRVGHCTFDVTSGRMTLSDELKNILGAQDAPMIEAATWRRSLAGMPDPSQADGTGFRLPASGEVIAARIQRPDGTARDVEIIGAPDVEDDAGRPRMKRMVVRDITEQLEERRKLKLASEETKRLLEESDAVRRVLLNMLEDQREAERSVRMSEERLRLALQAAQQGLYDLNVQTGEAIVSPEYARMLGYDPATFHETNQAWLERLHPDDRPATERIYRDFLSGRDPEYRVEFRQRTAAGGWKWILSLGKIVEYDAGGLPLRMLGTYTDIDERKKIEEALRESEARYRSLVDSSPYAIALIQDGIIAFANPSAVQLLNADSAERLIGRSFTEFLSARGRDRAIVNVQALLNAAGPSKPIRANLRRLDGRFVPVEIVGVPVMRLGRPSLQVIAVDISDRIAAEEHLRRSNEQLRTLASRMEHLRDEEHRRMSRDLHDTLGQELTAVRMDLTLIARMSNIDDVRRQVAKTAEVVDRTIESTRRISLLLHPAVLDRLGFADALLWLSEEFQEHHPHHCRLSIPEQLPSLPNQVSLVMYRVAQEALTNIAKHAHATDVIIAVEVEHDQLRLQIQDNGVGIEHHEVKHPRGGLGIFGLRERLRMAGGELELKDAPERGTMLIARIPLTHTANPAGPA